MTCDILPEELRRKLNVICQRLIVYLTRAISSFGRALPWHGRGDRFKSGMVHQRKKHQMIWCFFLWSGCPSSRTFVCYGVNRKPVSSAGPPLRRIEPCLRAPSPRLIFIASHWSGCRELNPVFAHPKRAYYRYTTSRSLIFRSFLLANNVLNPIYYIL